MSDSPEADLLPERPVDPDWLALREPADTRARDAAAAAILPPLLHCLGEQLARRRAGQPVPDGGGGRPARPGLHVVDLGAGTGANLRWLAPRVAGLGGPAALDAQRWTLVDHDPRLRAWGPAANATVRADVADLPRLLTELGGADLVTAAALLDLLDGRALAAVVDAVVTAGVPAVFSLSVTGAVAMDPADPLDDAIAAAFDAHQRRDGRLGPDAGTRTARLFRERGWRVVVAPSPWLLGAGETDLVRAWLFGRFEAAVEWDPELLTPARAWLDRRDGQACAGVLSAVVEHVDVLALPAGLPTGPPS